LTLKLITINIKDYESQHKARRCNRKDVQTIFNHAKANGYALPAVNVIGSSSINGVLETAKNLNAPVIIQFSNGGGQFNAGKGLSNDNHKAAIAGCIAGAKHVHEMAEAYGVPVILHTDHCAKKLSLG
jgi:Fructose/tagatose bisphosphate aldolase